MMPNPTTAEWAVFLEDWATRPSDVSPQMMAEMVCAYARQQVEAFRERADLAHTVLWLKVFASWKARDFDTLKEVLDAEQENYAAAIAALNDAPPQAS